MKRVLLLTSGALVQDDDFGEADEGDHGGQFALGAPTATTDGFVHVAAHVHHLHHVLLLTLYCVITQTSQLSEQAKNCVA